MMELLYRRTAKRCVNRRTWAKLAEQAGDAPLLVNWEDIRGDAEWRPFSEISKDCTVRMHTAGWLVAVHDDRLILVSTRYRLSHEESGGNTTAIPAGCVIEVTKD